MANINESIRSIEDALKSLGFDPGTIDGVADDKLEASINAGIKELAGFLKIQPPEQYTPEYGNTVLLPAIQKFRENTTYGIIKTATPQNLQSVFVKGILMSAGIDSSYIPKIPAAVKVFNDAENYIGHFNAVHARLAELKAAPPPVATEPSPVATEPSPVATEPSPAATEPSPAATEPSPAATEPSPTQPEQQTTQGPSAFDVETASKIVEIALTPISEFYDAGVKAENKRLKESGGSGLLASKINPSIYAPAEADGKLDKNEQNAVYKSLAQLKERYGFPEEEINGAYSPAIRKHLEAGLAQDPEIVKTMGGKEKAKTLFDSLDVLFAAGVLNAGAGQEVMTPRNEEFKRFVGKLDPVILSTIQGFLQTILGTGAGRMILGLVELFTGIPIAKLFGLESPINETKGEIREQIKDLYKKAYAEVDENDPKKFIDAVMKYVDKLDNQVVKLFLKNSSKYADKIETILKESNGNADKFADLVLKETGLVRGPIGQSNEPALGAARGAGPLLKQNETPGAPPQGEQLSGQFTRTSYNPRGGRSAAATQSVQAQSNTTQTQQPLLPSPEEAVAVLYNDFILATKGLNTGDLIMMKDPQYGNLFVYAMADGVHYSETLNMTDHMRATYQDNIAAMIQNAPDFKVNIEGYRITNPLPQPPDPALLDVLTATGGVGADRPPEVALKDVWAKYSPFSRHMKGMTESDPGFHVSNDLKNNVLAICNDARIKGPVVVHEGKHYFLMNNGEVYDLTGTDSTRIKGVPQYEAPPNTLDAHTQRNTVMARMRRGELPALDGAADPLGSPEIFNRLERVDRKDLPQYDKIPDLHKQLQQSITGLYVIGAPGSRFENVGIPDDKVIIARVSAGSRGRVVDYALFDKDKLGDPEALKAAKTYKEVDAATKIDDMGYSLTQIKAADFKGKSGTADGIIRSALFARLSPFGLRADCVRARGLHSVFSNYQFAMHGHSNRKYLRLFLT